MSNVAKNIEQLFMRPFGALDPLGALQDALLKNAENIIDINQRQLDEGENATTGAPLDAYKPYSLEVDPLTGVPLDEPMQYDEYKNRLNPDAGFGNPDLKLTGSFQGKMFLTITKTETIISSRDAKTRKLERQYGRDLIFGIQPRNHVIIVMYIRKQLELTWRQQMRLR